MNWKIGSKGEAVDRIVNILLANRGLKTKKEIDEFLNPPDPLSYSFADLLINTTQLRKAVTRILKAVSKKEPIVVYGDYDADGICAAAIMWEALQTCRADALPYIPQREKEGYGLSKEGIDNVLRDTKYQIQNTSGVTKGRSWGLIIAVDSGIVAHDAVGYAKSKGLDVIIVDHHEKPETLPKTSAIVHTTKLCAAGIAYYVSSQLVADRRSLTAWLELAAVATVTDLMPLIGPNRSIVKYGLEALNKTARPGLRALFSVAGIKKIGAYEIGYLIGPRLNASGRIESALTALRLLCTKNDEKALAFAGLLDKTNKDRQLMVETQTRHALAGYEQNSSPRERIIVINHESYHQGVIGLIAGKLVEKYYLPSIVIARGEVLSKASARSISGFNIIEAIRATQNILVNAGGHPMAAGFTIETARIEEFESKIKKIAKAKISPGMLERTLRIDVSIPLDFITFQLYELLTQLAPFGLGNPEPVFASRGILESFRTVGADGKHLKLQILAAGGGRVPAASLDAIAFNQGSAAEKLIVGQPVFVAYSVALDTFNNHPKIQLKIKDIRHD